MTTSVALFLMLLTLRHIFCLAFYMYIRFISVFSSEDNIVQFRLHLKTYLFNRGYPL